MANGIHPDDRELFSLAGIDYSDVPDLPLEQQGNGASSSSVSVNANKSRTITFEDDEPDHFQASIADTTGVKLTLPFLQAQVRKGTPNQAAAADKAVTGLPLFVYGSKLFPEVLAQQLGLPKFAAMRLANNYIPAVLPWCTRYCVAGDVPLAAVVHNHDEPATRYANNPYRESHVRGALVMGIHEQYKQVLDAAYGGGNGEARWGVYKRVAVDVRVQLVGWDTPGWIVADTYVWNKSMARLRCFQDDLRWTPHLFVAYCQRMKREAAEKGVAYDGPPLWTPEDEAAWSRHQIRLRQAYHNRVAFEHKGRLILATERHSAERQMMTDQARKATKEDLEGWDVISIDSDNSEMEREKDGNEAFSATTGHGASTKAYKSHAMADAIQDGPKRTAAASQYQLAQEGHKEGQEQTNRTSARSCTTS